VRLALVTTAGVHLRQDPPFDMQDPQGDASFRLIPHATAAPALTITHDYYDHRDADRDVNIVLPLARLQELVERGVVGEAAPRHVSFMGHIDGPHLTSLVERTAPEAARLLVADGVQAALLTPA
jgi:D-proline reductase (dithiol) PrdB